MAEINQVEQQNPSILWKHRNSIEEALASVVSSDDLNLKNMLRYHMGWEDEHGHPTVSGTGKGLRSSLCVYACEAVGGTASQSLSLAASVELIHNFSLIHDDIQDEDTERRHRPTLWSIWGKPMALQAGNVLRVLADMGPQQLNQKEVDPDILASCSKILTTACLEIIEGQFLDLSFEGKTDIGISRYIDMITRKTGALIRSAMHLGAISGTENPRDIESLANCGHYLGLLFQIRDDYLGIWGSDKETGKPTGSDIIRKKNSLPIVYGLERADDPLKKRIRQIYSQVDIQSDDVDMVISLLEDTKAPEYINKLALENANKARKAIEHVSLIPGASTDLEELLDFLLNRQS